MTLTIRPRAETDAADGRRLLTGHLDYHETRVSAAIYAATWGRLLWGAPDEFRELPAVDGDRPVGRVHFLFHRHCWRVENVCYLQDLFTDPVVLGRGVARALIEAVYAAADAEGAPAVYWLTQSSTIAAGCCTIRSA